MEYYNTKVYNSLRIFFKDVGIHTNKVPRDKKFSLITPIFIDIEKMMFYIGKACENSDVFIEYLDKCINIIDNLKIHIRNLKELGLITKTGFSILCIEEEEIVRQFVGWKNSKIKQQ